MFDWAVFLGGEERYRVIKCQKPHRVFEKCSGLWHDFSAYGPLEKNVFGDCIGMP